MRRRDALALLAGAALPWPLRARAGQAELDEAVGFAGQVLFLAVKTPALVIGVVRNGQTSIQGFGRRADGTTRRADGDTLFRIGSITKAFTGQVLASLAADGVVSLADPLTKYVPEFIAPLSEGGRPIRLIDLATHSAGLPREVPHEPGRRTIRLSTSRPRPSPPGSRPTRCSIRLARRSSIPTSASTCSPRRSRPQRESLIRTFSPSAC